MMRTIGVVALAVTAALPGTPAHAMAVSDDLVACTTVAFGRPVTGAGSFTATGVLTGPGTITLPVADARPIVLTGATSWSGCVGGGYRGASAGEVVFTLQIHAAEFSTLTVVTCAVSNGTVSCS